jgi:hypothetical protein
MDGPFAAQIETISSDVWNLKCIQRDSSQNTCIFERLISPEIFTTSLLKASEVLLQFCSQKLLVSRDVTALEQNLITLKRVFKAH